MKQNKNRRIRGNEPGYKKAFAFLSHTLIIPRSSEKSKGVSPF